MENRYAILDKQGGWLVNLIIWDGDTEKWQPPDGTVALKASDVDFEALSDIPE